jgi:RNA recognition motif-containing protein
MNIYVGNLSLDVTEDELRREFSVFGQVESVNILNNRDISSGQQCGYAYVKMVVESEGDAAIANLRGKLLKNRAIEVIESLCFTGNTDENTRDSRRGGRFNRQKQRTFRNRFNRLP